MSTVVISQVRSWQPATLSSTGFALARAADGLKEATGDVGSQMSGLQGSWEGQAADAAEAQARTQVKSGLQLAGGLAAAGSILSDGAADIGEARDHLLRLVDHATGEGFTVSDTGAVKAPPAPCFSAPPNLAGAAAQAAVAKKQQAAQAKLNAKAKEYAEDIQAALKAVAAADSAVASGLGSIDIPAGMHAAVQSYLDRVIANPDEANGPAGNPAVELAKAAKKAKGLFDTGKDLSKFLTNFRVNAPMSSSMMANAADAANGLVGNSSDGGFLGKAGAKAADVLGRDPEGALASVTKTGGQVAAKVALPLTIGLGAKDAIFGTDHDGARGVADRVAGGVGSAGAAAALAGGTVLAGTAAAPVLVVAGTGAVVAYGAWSVGNVIYDNREAIAHGAESVAKTAYDGVTIDIPGPVPLPVPPGVGFLDDL